MRTPNIPKVIIKQTDQPCFCGKKTGKVWVFILPDSRFTAITAHTKCYRKKIIGDN